MRERFQRKGPQWLYLLQNYDGAKMCAVTDLRFFKAEWSGQVEFSDIWNCVLNVVVNAVDQPIRVRFRNKGNNRGDKCMYGSRRSFQIIPCTL